jgi:peptide/nickel transport system permease protein
MLLIPAMSQTRTAARRVTARAWNSYLLRRVGRALLTILAVSTFTFFLVRLMPGNPVDVFIHDQIMTYGQTYEQALEQARGLFALDLRAPLSVQYLQYLGNLMRGDFGQSILSPGTPVIAIISRFLPWTMFSVGLALMLSFALGVALGMLMAYRRGTWLDHALTVFATVTTVIPNYLLGILLLVFLGVQTRIINIAAIRGSLSPGVQPEVSLAFLLDALYHAALPIVTYVLATLGGWMLTMKASALAVLGEDYVAFARARGLPDRRIAAAYLGRNALLPLFTQLTIAIGFVVGGSALIEFVFNYQGIGFVLYDATVRRDYPVMQGVFLVITVAVVLANLLADVFYGWIDPRIDLREGRG